MTKLLHQDALIRTNIVQLQIYFLFTLLGIEFFKFFIQQLKLI